MKDLQLARTIPLVGLGALVLVGCGGRSIDEPGGGGSGASDPTSDDNFEESVLDSFAALCRRQERCDYYSEFDDVSECAEYSAYSIEQAFDLDSRACRKHLLDALDCLVEQDGCDDSIDLCENEIEELGENCSDNNGNYYYY